MSSAQSPGPDVRTVPAPPPATDDLDGRLILRDGSVASVRIAGPGDRDAVRAFFHHLSPESKQKRFFSAGDPSDQLIDSMSGSTSDGRELTLVVSRRVDGEDCLVAVASYIAITNVAAEVAFAVDDRFHGKGLAMLLLERLAALAAGRGFQSFHATTLGDNMAMREVFRDSGFEIRSRSQAGIVDLQLSISPSAESVASAERRRKLATAASLQPILAPRAVAVIGASRDATKMGARILKSLRSAGFPGPIYPIHPHASEVGGLPAFLSARHLPTPADLAIIAVPPDSVPAAVDDCAAAGVRGLVVVTAGYAEIGAEGRTRQQRLLEKVRGYGMRMVGPNCMGVLNTDPAIQLNASFSPVFPPAGHIAFSSQSGALGIAILRLAEERGVGLSAFVSVGNKADVSSNDLLEYWEDDPHTRVILLYLESFGNPRRFARLARRVGRSKPIIALKAGRTRAGSRAAGSHTAALAASDLAVDALFHQAGVIRADTIDEMFDIAACLDAQPLPRGTRVGVITNAGGPGILAVDACEAAGLTVVEFSASTRARLQTFLPSTASIGNPVDMVASAGPDAYRAAIEAVLASDDIDALLVIYTPVDPSRSEEILSAIQDAVTNARAAGVSDKPILASVMAGTPGRASLKTSTEVIPTYTFPENAVRALGKIAAYATWRAQPAGLFWGFDDINLEKVREICRAAVASGGGWLTDRDTWDVLHAFAMPVAVHSLAQTADDAVALASVIGFPVAAKLASTKATHKTELGVVRLNLTSAADVRTAFAEITARAVEALGKEAIDGIVIQPMINGGVETIVGIAHDPVFGPLVAFGIGGVNVEVFGDVRFRVAPLTDRDADAVLHEIKGLPLLTGHRGSAPVDMEALRDVLLRVSRLAEDVPEIEELDLNPTIALGPGQGCRIVDARIRVAAPRHTGGPGKTGGAS